MKNKPAFPVYASKGDWHQRYDGMTLRDYFAAAALTGLLSNPKLLVKAKHKLTEVERLAASANKSRRAYEYADAMLAEHEKGQS